MKQTILLMGFSILFCIPRMNAQDTSYFSDSYVMKYKNSPGFLSPDQAQVFLDAFRKHKNKAFGKKQLKNAWSLFDQVTFKDIVNDEQTDSVIFYLAAYPTKTPRGKEYKKRPFVIMQTKKKPTPSSTVNTSAQTIFIFLVPPDICPPPKTGCKVYFEN